jgi:hypothetical protein
MVGGKIQPRTNDPWRLIVAKLSQMKAPSALEHLFGAASAASDGATDERTIAEIEAAADAKYLAQQMEGAETEEEANAIAKSFYG